MAYFYNAGVPDVEVAVIKALPQCSGHSGNSPTSGLAKGLSEATGETANAKKENDENTNVPLLFNGSAETCVHLGFGMI